MVVFIGHEASRTGAQIPLLHLPRWLEANTDSSYSILLNDGGPLEDDCRALAPA